MDDIFEGNDSLWRRYLLFEAGQTAARQLV